MPPGYTLGVSKVVGRIPVVDAGETPSLCNTSVVCHTVEFKIVLSSGDGKHYTGSVVANARNITVSATLITYLRDFNEYVMNTTIYIDGTPVFHADELRLVYSLYTGSCSKTVPVEYNNEPIAYILTLELSTTNKNENNDTGSENNTSPGNKVVNTIVQLSPIYINESTSWGEMPVLDRLVGTSIVNATNITVEAFYTGDGYDVHIYINSTHAFDTHTALPATLEFSYDGAEYRIDVILPSPPVLNQTITSELVPVDETQVALPNGTVVNVIIYMVNQTTKIEINNITIVVYGYVSRLQIDLDIYVFGVPQQSIM